MIKLTKYIDTFKEELHKYNINDKIIELFANKFKIQICEMLEQTEKINKNKITLNSSNMDFALVMFTDRKIIEYLTFYKNIPEIMKLAEKANKFIYIIKSPAIVNIINTILESDDEIKTIENLIANKNFMTRNGLSGEGILRILTNIVNDNESVSYSDMTPRKQLEENIKNIE